jgi:hypothetical protein
MGVLPYSLFKLNQLRTSAMPSSQPFYQVVVFPSKDIFLSLIVPTVRWKQGYAFVLKVTDFSQEEFEFDAIWKEEFTGDGYTRIDDACNIAIKRSRFADRTRCNRVQPHIQCVKKLAMQLKRMRFKGLSSHPDLICHTTDMKSIVFRISVAEVVIGEK